MRMMLDDLATNESTADVLIEDWQTVGQEDEDPLVVVAGSDGLKCDFEGQEVVAGNPACQRGILTEDAVGRGDDVVADVLRGGVLDVEHPRGHVSQLDLAKVDDIVDGMVEGQRWRDVEGIHRLDTHGVVLDRLVIECHCQ